MSRTSCTTEPQELLQYWLGELDEAHESRLDEHLFACSACSERLRTIVDLGAAIRSEFASGTLNVVLPEPFIRAVKEAGLRVREYTLDPGGSVACTVTPDDDLVVAYLHAPLRDVRRLDILIDDTTSGKHRANDVAFDPAAEWPGRRDEHVVPANARLLAAARPARGRRRGGRARHRGLHVQPLPVLTRVARTGQPVTKQEQSWRKKA